MQVYIKSHNHDVHEGGIRGREEKSSERVACVGWPSMTARSDFQGSRPSFDRENNVLGDDMAAWPALRKQKIEQAAGQKRYRDGYV